MKKKVVLMLVFVLLSGTLFCGEIGVGIPFLSPGISLYSGSLYYQEVPYINTFFNPSDRLKSFFIEYWGSDYLLKLKDEANQFKSALASSSALELDLSSFGVYLYFDLYNSANIREDGDYLYLKSKNTTPLEQELEIRRYGSFYSATFYIEGKEYPWGRFLLKKMSENEFALPYIKKYLACQNAIIAMKVLFSCATTSLILVPVFITTAIMAQSPEIAYGYAVGVLSLSALFGGIWGGLKKELPKLQYQIVAEYSGGRVKIRY